MVRMRGRGTRSRCQDSLGLFRWSAGFYERREHCASRRSLSRGKTDTYSPEARQRFDDRLESAYLDRGIVGGP